MDIQVHKLTKELLDDWLFFFDHDGFTDNKSGAAATVCAIIGMSN